MKRRGNLFPRITDRENLLEAFRRASRGRITRGEVAAMRANLDQELGNLAASLEQGSPALGKYRQFLIHDPKRRVITAPCFRERVIHHAIMNVCEPVIDRWLIDDTYACRPGKGREAAVLRAACFARRWPWRLHLDVRQYFDSVPHDRLLRRLERVFKDRRLLSLFAEIIRSFRGSLGRGLPIGSLISQHVANFYLGWLDRFVKETLRIRGYVRYMDDLVIWGDDADQLARLGRQAEAFLADELGLAFKPAHSGPSARGLEFLGCRIFPTHTILSRRSRRRFRRRVRMLERCGRFGLLEDREIQQRLDAVVAFARSADVRSWRFREAVLHSFVVSDP